MLIIYKIENGITFYYNITTNTWEKDPKKGTLIKDVDVAYKLRNSLNLLNLGQGSVKWVKEKYVYEVWCLGGDYEDYRREILTFKEFNEEEINTCIEEFCREIIKKKNINLLLWGMNFMRKEYMYEEL